MSERLTGEEREVQFLGGAAIDGAPIAFVIVMAAVVTALAFIPFSVIIGEGGAFSMAQGIWPLVGWLLGPIAGAVADGIGTLVGVFVAPHTAGVAGVTVWGSIVGGFTAGVMVLGKERSRWWLPLVALWIVEWLLFAGRGIVQNGVGVWPAITMTFINWSAILLWVLPTRTLFARWINSQNAGKLAAGLFIGTWMVMGLSHLSQSVITYFMFNWPNELWVTLTPIIPVQHLARCVIGTVVGTGVILGLRAIGLVKPKWGIY
jgi:hypothetical protein